MGGAGLIMAPLHILGQVGSFLRHGAVDAGGEEGVGCAGGFVMERLAHRKDLHHQQHFLAASVPHHQS
jgi:hypothetical protein